MKSFHSFIDTTPRYIYDDVYIIPSYSEVISRQTVHLPGDFSEFGERVPVISSNMDTITGAAMSKAMFEAGAVGALHRFMSIEDNVKAWEESGKHGFVSVGVNRDSKDRAKALYEAGARDFIIDIAHGHSLAMKEMIQWMKSEFASPALHIMAGNVTTPRAVKDLESWGATSVKVGIGPGSVCLTKDVTGVTMPIFSAVLECAAASNIPIIADGGIKKYGDVAKAIGAGAQAVMIGGLFAGCDETPPMVELKEATLENDKLWGNFGHAIELGSDFINSANRELWSNSLYRLKKAKDNVIYRGMASTEAMKVIRSDGNLPTAEGKSISVEPKGSAMKVVADIAGGLRSAYSYVGATNYTDYLSRVNFGVRHH